MISHIITDTNLKSSGHCSFRSILFGPKLLNNLQLLLLRKCAPLTLSKACWNITFLSKSILFYCEFYAQLHHLLMSFESFLCVSHSLFIPIRTLMIWERVPSDVATRILWQNEGYWRSMVAKPDEILAMICFYSVKYIQHYLSWKCVVRLLNYH